MFIPQEALLGRIEYMVMIVKGKWFIFHNVFVLLLVTKVIVIVFHEWIFIVITLHNVHLKLSYKTRVSC